MIDKIFKAYDVRATYPNPLNEEAAWKVGHATAQFFKRSRQNVDPKERVKLENTIVVGRDMRPSSPELSKALIDGIRSVGVDVIDVGMVDTSFIYFAVNHVDSVGGIMCTASHNPIQYNGFKISGPKARPIGSATGLDDIKRIAVTLRVGHTGLQGKYEQQNMWDGYRAHIRKFLDLKRPITVAVDASNGMGGVMVPKIFDGVPNLKIIPMLFEITGSFTHDPNPLVEENLRGLKELMAKNKVDLGACFDGDADRCIFIDERETTIGCDHLTALLAKDFLAKPENRGSTVIYDLRSSHSVPEEIEKAGGVPRRERVGHSFMKSTLAATKGVFGGELSGHFYFRDSFNTDSGAIAFACLLTVLSKQDKPLSELMKPFKRYAQSGELNFQVEDKDGAIVKLAESYKKAKIDYLDGITVDTGEGWWFNVRKSNTEPLLRLNLEARDPKMLSDKLGELKKILGEPAHGH